MDLRGLCETSCKEPKAKELIDHFTAVYNEDAFRKWQLPDAAVQRIRGKTLLRTFCLDCVCRWLPPCLVLRPLR